MVFCMAYGMISAGYLPSIMLLLLVNIFSETLLAAVSVDSGDMKDVSHLASRHRSDLCDLRLRCPSRMPEVR